MTINSWTAFVKLILLCRRDELAIGLTTAEGAEALLSKYTKADVERAMQAYVNEGRQAMGPSYLKVFATLKRTHQYIYGHCPSSSSCLLEILIG